MKLNIFLFIICLCLPGRYACAAEDIENVLIELETKMSKIDTIQTGFIQEKQLSLFNQKVILEGMMYIQKASRLAWHVYKPVRYSTIIVGDTICQWDEETDNVRKIPIMKNPAFGAALEQMRVWVLGNYLDLLSNYNITMSTREPLVLEFVPYDTTVASKVIRKISISFREDQSYIRQIHIEEKDGDSTQFTFYETQLNYSIDPKAWVTKQHVQ